MWVFQREGFRANSWGNVVYVYKADKTFCEKEEYYLF